MGCGASSEKQEDTSAAKYSREGSEKKNRETVSSRSSTVESEPSAKKERSSSHFSQEQQLELAIEKLQQERMERMMQDRRGSVGLVCDEPGAAVGSVKRGWAHVKAKVLDHIKSKKDSESLAAFEEMSRTFKPSKKLVTICQSWLKEVHEAGVDASEAEESLQAAHLQVSKSPKASLTPKEGNVTPPAATIEVPPLNEGLGAHPVANQSCYLDCVLGDKSIDLPGLMPGGSGEDRRGSQAHTDDAQTVSQVSMSSFFCASTRSARTTLSMVSNSSRGANGLSTMKLANGSSILRRSPQTHSLQPKKYSMEETPNSQQGDSQGAPTLSPHQQSLSTTQNVDDMDALLYGS